MIIAALIVLVATAGFAFGSQEVQDVARDKIENCIDIIVDANAAATFAGSWDEDGLKVTIAAKVESSYERLKEYAIENNLPEDYIFTKVGECALKSVRAVYGTKLPGELKEAEALIEAFIASRKAA